MPYRLIRQDGQFCVAKENGKVISGGCHDTRKKALAHLRALYANEANMKDTMVIVGGQVKALGQGKVGGPLVTFSGPVDTDLIRDFFTSETEFFIEDGARLPVLFEHGFDPNVKRARLGYVTVNRKSEGLYVEGSVDLTTEHGKSIYKRVEADELYWSSGAAGHMVERRKVDNAKSHWIAMWGLAEASLTDSPAEYRNEAVSLKTFIDSLQKDEGSCGCGDSSAEQSGLSVRLNQHVDDRVDDGHTRDAIIKSLAKESGLQVETVILILDDSYKPNDANLKAFARVLNIDFDMLKAATKRDYAKTIKGMFEEALSEQVPSRWQLDSVYCDIVRKIAHTAQASAITGVEFDSEAKIKEATGEYLNRLQELAVNQVNDYVESGSDEPFYLKAIIDPSSDLLVSGGLDLEQHSQLMVSVLRDVVRRFRANHEQRKRGDANHKAGRVLSQANRQRLSNMLEQIQSAVVDCQKLLEESQPMASEEKMRAAKTRHLALRHERRMQLGA